MSYNIFISYAREDIEFAVQLHTFLREEGFRPWMDKKDILPGQNWDLTIKKQLEKADFIILMISSISIKKKGYVQEEFKIALDYCKTKEESDIFLIPCKLNDCELPSNLNQYHWVDIDSVDSMQQIAKAIRFKDVENGNNSSETTNVDFEGYLKDIAHETKYVSSILHIIKNTLGLVGNLKSNLPQSSITFKFIYNNIKNYVFIRSLASNHEKNKSLEHFFLELTSRKGKAIIIYKEDLSPFEKLQVYDFEMNHENIDLLKIQSENQFKFQQTFQKYYPL